MRLLVFTLKFPFDGSEPFLTHELRYLADHFQVTLVPLFVGKELNDLPENVLLDLSLAKLVEDNHERKVYPVIGRLGQIFKAILKHQSFSYTAVRDVSGFVHYGSLVEKWANQNVHGGDVLYSYWLERVAYGLTKFKQRHPKTIVISRAHGFDVYESRRAHGFIPFRKDTLGALNRVFCISEDGKNELTKAYKFSEKIEVAKLGIPDPGEFRNEPGEGLIFVSCSALVKLKRVEKIAELMKSYALNAPETSITWQHFGEGPTRQKVEETIQDSPENLRVLLHGQVPNTTVLDFYKKNYVDAFINLSTSEGIPVSMMEAQSFGIPVLATDVGGVSEIVDAATGRLIEVNLEPNEAVKALKEITEDTTLRAAARANFLDNYCAEKNFTEFVKSLKELMS